VPPDGAGKGELIMARQQNTGWSTKNEIEFITGLGSFGPGKNRDVVKCLKGYIKAAKHRSEWGDINKQQAVRTAEAMLHAIS